MTNTTLSPDAQACKVTIETTPAGKRWVQIKAPFGGARFAHAIREIATAHGVDLTQPGCRVIRRGERVWESDGKVTRTSFTYYRVQTLNTAGYWLPVAV